MVQILRFQHNIIITELLSIICDFIRVKKMWINSIEIFF